MCENEIRATGNMADILAEFGAPEKVAQKLARRIGAAVVQKGITPHILKEKIQDNLDFRGLPNWENVDQTLGKAVTRIYQGKPPFPNKL